ncbi:DUF1642 domain-containing protein [Enterococcus asini]|uniref:DUF1642 domain-containing protein n=1 Tax=Enterococcus asini TaxID=57732 RepID=UPI0032E469EC
MKVSEAIEKLTIKRDDALHFQKLYRAGDVGWSANESKAIAFNIAINTLQQIDEPQAEKQEVSQEFADWVEKAKTVKDGLDYKNWCVKEIATIGWGNWLHDPERILDGKVIYNEWVNAVADNKEKHIKAIYDGYTVKPKRWVVTTTDSDTCYLKRFRMGKECLDGDISKVWVGERSWAFTFDDKSKAEAVATLVEGSVEEV